MNIEQVRENISLLISEIVSLRKERDSCYCVDVESMNNGTYTLRVVDNVLIYDIPAWSLSALLELMPSYLFEFERGIDLNLYPSINRKVWLCSYMPNVIENRKTDKFKQITHADSLVDAAYEMIIWLKENNYL